MVLRGENVEELEEGGQKRRAEGGEGRHDGVPFSWHPEMHLALHTDTHPHLLIFMPVAFPIAGITVVNHMLSGVKWPRFKPGLPLTGWVTFSKSLNPFPFSSSEKWG